MTADRIHDYPLACRTVGHLLADKAQRIGDRTCLIFGGQRYAYADVHELSNRYANGFRALGVEQEDKSRSKVMKRRAAPMPRRSRRHAGCPH